MEAAVEPAPAPAADAPRRRPHRRRPAATALTALAALLGVLVVFAIIWRVADGAWPAIKLFELSFLWHNEWNAR